MNLYNEFSVQSFDFTLKAKEDAQSRWIIETASLFKRESDWTCNMEFSVQSFDFALEAKKEAQTRWIIETALLLQRREINL